MLVDGWVPHDILSHLGTASLTPLAKPDGGIRPLAVGEFFRRFISRNLCLQFQNAFRENLRPHQYAVGIGAACEAIYIRARDHRIAF